MEQVNNDFIHVESSVTLGPSTYQLRSNILHKGARAASGHYVAVAHHPTPEGQEYWYYNDSVRRAAFSEQGNGI